jgi:hypothetical protein
MRFEWKDSFMINPAIPTILSQQLNSCWTEIDTKQESINGTCIHGIFDVKLPDGVPLDTALKYAPIWMDLSLACRDSLPYTGPRCLAF